MNLTQTPTTIGQEAGAEENRMMREQRALDGGSKVMRAMHEASSSIDVTLIRSSKKAVAHWSHVAGVLRDAEVTLATRNRQYVEMLRALQRIQRCAELAKARGSAGAALTSISEIGYIVADVLPE